MAAVNTLTAKLSVNIRVEGAVTADFTNAVHNVNENVSLSLGIGTGANQSNAIWSDQRTLTDTDSETLDFGGGGAGDNLTNALSQAITMSAIKWIIIENTSTTDSLLVGGAAANEFLNWVGAAGDKIRIRPGGVFVIGTNDATGYVAGSTAGDIKFENEGSPNLIYNIWVVGLNIP